jgi:hypothetical protein
VTHKAIEINLERNLSGLEATAIQLIKRQSANPGKFANNPTARIKGKLQLKLISCETRGGTIARIPISRPKTRICQGYSKMLIPFTTNLPRCSDSNEAMVFRLNAHNEPVINFVQNRQVATNANSASSQHLWTFL